MFFWYVLRNEKTPVYFRSCIGLAVEQTNLSSTFTDSRERSHLQDISPSATQNIHHKMAVSLLLKIFQIDQSLCYSKHPQDGNPSTTQNIQHKMAVSLFLKTFITTVFMLITTFKNGSLSASRNIHKMAIYLILQTFITKWQSLYYSKYLSQNDSLFAIHNIQKRQALCFSKHPQDGNISATQNIYHKIESICYSKHSSQNGSLFATQNIYHKMAVAPLPKTFITKWRSLCY